MRHLVDALVLVYLICIAVVGTTLLAVFIEQRAPRAKHWAEPRAGDDPTQVEGGRGEERAAERAAASGE